MSSLLALAGLLCAPSGGALTILNVHPDNPRFFANTRGEAVLLTGSHHWYNLLDRSDRPLFDYEGYLDLLVENNHNFIRMWTWEHAVIPLPNGGSARYAPLPYARTGPGPAFDGDPRFDLTQGNPEYFDRLRSRVVQAGQRGLFVSIMLFEGWSVTGYDSAAGAGAPFPAWKGHPFHPDNNINGIDGDADGDGIGHEVHSLLDPEVTRIQEAYVRRVVDAVNDLDNVLYEIANESWGGSWEWQYHMIRYVKDYQATKPRQHPVGMTVCGNGPGYVNQWIPPEILFNAPADWVSPASDRRYGDYRTDPPPSSGDKVIILDTDHIFGIGGNRSWVWRSFCRGHHPVFMDPLDEDPLNESWPEIRQALGLARLYAKRLDLANMSPNDGLVSTGFCLADPGSQYAVYLPEGGPVTVDLASKDVPFRLEWLDVTRGRSLADTDRIADGAVVLTAPFDGPAVLIAVRRPQAPLVWGVNLGGERVTVGGETWLAHAEALHNGMILDGGTGGAAEPGGVYSPPVPEELGAALGSYVHGDPGSHHGLRIRQPLPVGRYSVYLWMAEHEAPCSRNVEVRIQDLNMARGLGCFDVGGWGEYGPYPANVTNGILTVEIRADGNGPVLSGITAFPAGPDPAIADSLTLSMLADGLHPRPAR